MSNNLYTILCIYTGWTKSRYTIIITVPVYTVYYFWPTLYMHVGMCVCVCVSYT